MEPHLRRRDLLLLLPLAVSGCSAGAPHRGEAVRAQALFEAYWQETARLYPEWATWRGDHRYGDRLADASPAGRAAALGYWRELLGRIDAIDRDRLGAEDRLSLDLLRHDTETVLTRHRHPGLESMSLTAIDGFHAELPALLRGAPVDSAERREQMLGRLAAYPRRVDQEIEHLREGMALGWVGARPVLELVQTQLDRLVEAPLADSPLLEPAGALPESLPQAERERFRERLAARVRDDVLPALRRLRAFVTGPYMARAPLSGALSDYPDGAAAYAAVVEEHTTTPLSPRRVHEEGLELTESLHRQMIATMHETGFGGSFGAFNAFMHSDPRFFAPSAAALLGEYRAIAQRVEQALPRLFSRTPTLPYEVRAMPEFAGPDQADAYEGPAPDGSRPGRFMANTNAYARKPRWEMETLVAHELMPGHHLQVALALELDGLPEFRRHASYTAYIEGWALYAETLGYDLGLYQDPYSRYGHLSNQAWRAARLVVDTGLHAFGWSRQRAIDFMVSRAGLGPEVAAAETDRYLSWPGQALAYMTGCNEITRLRDGAQRALGARFDLRRFHATVLGAGPLPLALLAQRVQRWVAGGGQG